LNACTVAHFRATKGGHNEQAFEAVREESKSRSDWAEEINASYRKSIEGILKMGLTLIAAKDALDHGQFLEMIEHDLPFEASTAERLMKIARDPRITNAAHAQFLPMAWGTLYELSKLPDAAFEQAVSSGDINPKMTRTEAVQLAAPSRNVTHDEPVKAGTDDVETLSPRHEPEIVAALALPQLEKIVAKLVGGVQRGEIVIDPTFEARVRGVADLLMALFGEERIRTGKVH
jgi:hypothetical protein